MNKLPAEKQKLLNEALELIGHSPSEEGSDSDLAGIASGGSPTLAQLDRARRPKEHTACEDCPNSVWFASPTDVKCYCRVMYLVTWSTKDPNRITVCDGMSIGQD